MMSASRRVEDAKHVFRYILARLTLQLSRSSAQFKALFISSWQLLRNDPAVFRHFVLHLFNRHVLTLCTFIVLLWIWVLNWGEFSTFNASVEKCDWSSWEQWPSGARPHHLVFVADPQLVDPHTYPGRPWPLSTATVAHTDLYLTRAYDRIRHTLEPDTVMFLGDLFDGGREWSTRTSESPEQQYHAYTNDFWQKEFARFSRIFLRDRRFKQHNTLRTIASLPGNHDLGFASGVQLPVRERFNAYFGESNRVDIVGNHSFVSLDSVSLSAKDLPNSDMLLDIWKPASDFLTRLHDQKEQSIDRHERHLADQLDQLHHPRRQVLYPIPSDRALEYQTLSNDKASRALPTILLTHVPLYRAPGTPCGPQREKYPPTPPPPGQTTPVEPDHRNALLVAAGYQYQNVLSRSISSEIVEALHGQVSWAFSGDDHDYCEVLHRGYSSPGHGIHEITVKSISWAMGVRLPGFLLVSLWNDMDKPVEEGSTTVQTHLCLLPDQLRIFIAYAKLIAFSLLALAARAVLVTLLPATFGPSAPPKGLDRGLGMLLPTHTSDQTDHKKRDSSPLPSKYSDTSSYNHREASLLASKNLNQNSAIAARTPRVSRGTSPSRPDHGGYDLGMKSNGIPQRTSSLRPGPNVPLINYASNAPGFDEPQYSDAALSSSNRRRSRSRLRQAMGEFVSTTSFVAFCGIAWYVWLLQY